MANSTPSTTTKEIASELAKFFSDSPNPLFFAGAGVAARARLPIWGRYVSQVAELARPSDPLISTVMLESVNEGDYLGAFSHYLLSRKIVAGDKYKFLAAPLKKHDESRILALARLPFKAYVTTNFDKSLHDAYAYVAKRSALEFDLDDESLNSALFEDGFFIARIHGRLEVPKTMVLAQEHYTKLLESRAYVNLLTHIFTRRQVVFLGFSFLDPAIRHVLKTIEQHIGTMHEGRHVAFLPNDIDGDFVKALDRFNIRKVFYDPSSEHTQLWDALLETAGQAERLKTTHKPIQEEPFGVAKRYLASCYARSQLRTQLVPLRYAVMEGIIGYHIQKAGSTGISSDEIVSRIREDLKIATSEAEDLVTQSVSALVQDGLSSASAPGGNRYIWTDNSPEPDVNDAITKITQTAVSRYVVREAGHDTSVVRDALRDFFQRLILQRGWDLGAAFAIQRPVEAIEIDKLMWACGQSLPPKSVESLVRACTDLLNNPDSSTASLLAMLGRASFALELVIQAPHDVLFHTLTLPQKIYLDANVLLPAITPGHPYHDVYKSSINRLTNAMSQAFARVQVIVYEGFLNEVVSHRRLAKEEMKDLTSVELKRQALYYGTENVNVFLGAYANQSLNDESLSFAMFLEKFAPYETEKELVRWLAKQGIDTVGDQRFIGTETIFGDIYHHLEVVFADLVVRKQRAPITIRHDAVQLAALDEDLKAGVRSVCVTADRRLREGIKKGRFAYLSNAMMNNIGLTQLIDLLVGTPLNARGITTLLWSAKTSSGTEAVRNYLIDVALQEYDEAVAMEMGDVVDRVAEKIVDSAERSGVDLRPKSAKAHAAAIRFLGTFEDQFYEALRKKIEGRRKE